MIWQLLVPPWLRKLSQDITRRDRFEYIPDEMAARASSADNEDYWSMSIAQERAACEAVMKLAKANEPLLSRNPDEHLKYAVYRDALTHCARHGNQLSILEYGGNLGDYYWLARTLFPDIALDYHCKELPAIADAGRALNPQITWHTDDECLSRTYDLVAFNSSLQYVDANLLAIAARASRCLLLSDVPAVRHAPAFFSEQRTADRATIQRHPNAAALVATVESTGMQLIREVDMGPHPHVVNAPEQPACIGWVFQRVAAE